MEAAEPALERLEIEAPAWVAAMWRESVAFARQLAGSPLPPGACLEMILAEAGSSAAPAPGAGAASCGVHNGVSHDLAGVVESADPFRPSVALEPPAPGAFSMVEALGASGPVLCDAQQTGPEGSRLHRFSHARETDLPALDARALDRALRDLLALRQRREASLAESLRSVGSSRSYRTDGFSSLEEYALERYGLSPRRLYYLLALERSLARLPALRRAFLDGRVTLRQALLIGSVATVVTAQRWVGRARTVTLRRLEDEVALWRHLRETRPQVWELLDGGPLPEGLLIVPGRSPGVHAFARAQEDKQAEEFLRALEADEETAPLPDRLCRIRLRVEPEVREMWEAALARCRAAVRADLEEWEALAILLREFWIAWDNVETRRQRRENPTLERDGWRCTVPACRSLGSGRLHEHHIIPRSAGGALDDPANLTTACAAHHLRLLHEGKVRCRGRAAGALVWEMGVERDREPFLLFEGERRVAGEAR